MTTNAADLRARLAALWERVNASTPDDEWPAVTLLTSGSGLDKVPPGFTAYAVGPWDEHPENAPASGRHVVVLPSVHPNAPLGLRRRLMARAVANGTGTCPLCSAALGLSQRLPGPGEPGRAVWHALPVYLAVRHATGCPADDWTETDRGWLLPPVGTAPEPDEHDDTDDTDEPTDERNTP